MKKNNTPTIGLSVILKNESKIVERMLKSVYPILDYFFIVDTGSTDNTIEIVENFFKDKNIPGKVISHKWKNFSDARNVALNGLKDKVDFGIWIDADEILNIPNNFNIKNFKNNLKGLNFGLINIFYNNVQYYRKQIFKVDDTVEWKYPVHEILQSNVKNPNIEIIKNLSITVNSDGNSWSSQTKKEKFENHANIFKEYLKENKDDSRAIFYLAQSLKDADGEDNLKEAIKWYKKRLSIITKGYMEELYYSALMIANIKQKLKYNKEDVLQSYLSCGQYNRNRVEHLYFVALYYQSISDYDTSYIYSNYMMKFAGKSPVNSMLFINSEFYKWQIYDLHSMNCFYTRRQQEGIKVFRKVLKNVNKIAEPHKTRILHNKKYFI